MHVTDMPLSSFSAAASCTTRQRLAQYTTTMFAKRVLCAGTSPEEDSPLDDRGRQDESEDGNGSELHFSCECKEMIKLWEAGVCMRMYGNTSGVARGLGCKIPFRCRSK